jgi:hydroxymethylpyrimidine pyrophosphatase-like HAD family hydrolase
VNASKEWTYRYSLNILSFLNIGTLSVETGRGISLSISMRVAYTLPYIKQKGVGVILVQGRMTLLAESIALRLGLNGLLSILT